MVLPDTAPELMRAQPRSAQAVTGEGRGKGVSDRAMRELFQILIPLSLAAVTLVLALGIYTLFRGGEFGRTWSNKLMRLRVLLQFCAILVLVAAAFWMRHAR
jgi:Hypoxia induced protein conserved region